MSFNIETTFSDITNIGENKLLIYPKGIINQHKGFLYQPINIINEDVNTFEIKYSLFDNCIQGILIFIDNIDITGSEILNKDTEIVFISAFSVTEKRVNKMIFKITDTVITELKHNFLYTLSLTDIFSFGLKNTYITKGYSGKKSDIFKQIIIESEQYKLYSSISNNKNEYLNLNIDDTNDESDFLIPSNVSVWDYFSKEFFKLGYRFYFENLNTLNVKKVEFSKISPKIVDSIKKEMFYGNKTENNNYFGYIIDFDISTLPTEKIKTLIPNEKNIKVGDDKSINTQSANASNVSSNLTLNSNVKDFTDDSQQIYTYQALESVNAKELIVENVLLTSTLLSVVVPLDSIFFQRYNSNGNVINVDLKGNPNIISSSLEGDTLNSGKYIVLGITEKYLFAYSKGIQKVILGRADFGRVREKIK